MMPGDTTELDPLPDQRRIAAQEQAAAVAIGYCEAAARPTVGDTVDYADPTGVQPIAQAARYNSEGEAVLDQSVYAILVHEDVVTLISRMADS